MKKMLLLLVLLCAVPIFGQGAAALARLFAPSDLPILPGMDADLHWSMRDADLDATGKDDYVIALYSNGLLGQLRVIVRTPNGPRLAAETSPFMHEKSPQLALLDVDADGRPEIFASFDVGRGHRAEWIFRWSGGALRCLNPTSKGARDAEETEALERAAVVDFDGDGKLEYIQPSDTFGEGVESGFMDNSFVVYKLNDGAFQLLPTAVPYFGFHERQIGKPVFESEGFRAEPGDYSLQVMSGADGTEVVDAAQVILNGVVVMSPDHFKGSKRRLSVPVTLESRNTIAVEVRSKPRSSLMVALVRSRE